MRNPNMCPILGDNCAEVAELRERAETAEAACAELRAWIDGLNASVPDSLRQYLLAGYRDPPLYNNLGQQMLDEVKRLRELRDAVLEYLDARFRVAAALPSDELREAYRAGDVRVRMFTIAAIEAAKETK